MCIDYSRQWLVKDEIREGDSDNIIITNNNNNNRNNNNSSNNNNNKATNNLLLLALRQQKQPSINEMTEQLQSQRQHHHQNHHHPHHHHHHQKQEQRQQKHSRRYFQHFQIGKVKRHNVTSSSSSSSASASTTSLTSSSWSSSLCAFWSWPHMVRVKLWPNQIVEVLLAIILVNYLVMSASVTSSIMVTAMDADEAPSLEDDDIIYRNPNRMAYFGYNLDELQQTGINNQVPRSQNFKISPKPCTFGRIEGTCMFVWECIKSEGRHVGMCVDSFMFGSCCSHNNNYNYTDNMILPSTMFAYTRPSKPSMGAAAAGGGAGVASITGSNFSQRPRPPHMPNKPIISGMTTIERPHGAGTLVIRPSGPHHQGALHKPQHNTKLPTTTTTTSRTTTTRKSTTTTATSSTSTTQRTTVTNLAELTEPDHHHHHHHQLNNNNHHHQDWSSNTIIASAADQQHEAAATGNIIPTSPLSSNTIWHSSSSSSSSSLLPSSASSSSPSAVPSFSSSALPSATQHHHHHQQQQHQHQHQHQQHWHMTTEPNFITKPRPPSWEKPTLLRPAKPQKPTKKPIVSESSAFATSTLLLMPPQTPSSTTDVYTKPSTTKPQTQQQQLLPATASLSPTLPWHLAPVYTKPSTTIRPTYTRPTTNWFYNQNSTISSGSSSHPGFGQPTKTTKPTTFSSNTAITTTMKYRPTASSTSTTQLAGQHGSTLTPTRPRPRPRPRPPASQSPSVITSLPPERPSATATTTTTTTTVSSLSVADVTSAVSESVIESNEITDVTSSNIISGSNNENNNQHMLGTVKTITAARTECGVPVLARPETRIVGGKSAAFGRWPWQVSVRRTSFFGFSSTHRCGGALINENWIATAGHCVDDLLISQIRIRVGEYDFSHVQEQLPYMERGVAKKVVHPKYNFFTYEYDLALVKLENPLEFAPHVSPICLPETDSLLIGMNATVTGWGRLSEGGTLPSVLQEVSVPIVSNDNCKSMFLRAGRQEFIPDIFLCAGYETGGQDSCQGDSGGPLQVRSQNGRFFLAGIISWGIGCAEANLPGVCTRISKFVPWILSHVK